jgi:two-component sensor histidine kinase
VSTLSELIKKHASVSNGDMEWFHLLVADWQIVADMTFADLVLWVPNQDGEFIAVAHARPSSAATIFYRDISGEAPRKPWDALIKKARTTGVETTLAGSDSFDGVQVRFAAVPVRRPISAKSQEVAAAPIAVVTIHNNVSESREPSKLQINYRDCGNALLQMISDGSYPERGNQTGPKRGAPRVNDGLIRLDADGTVQFASPNALSAFNRLGVAGELVAKPLAESVSAALKLKLRTDEDLALVLTGRAPWRTDLESRNLTLSVRAVPLRRAGERYGAIVLCRDVTELRRQERELITKDATIREIHHRVKNNLQTVASLLRIQSRRSESPEAKESLEQAMRRVSAIALVHDTLSSGLSQDVNFDEVFDRVMMLASEVASSHGTSVRNLLDGKFGPLKGEIATPLAVALTEIVTNAVEHGLEGRSGVVHVNAERKPKKLNITISDNGKGLVDGKVGEGLGTQIIRTLVEGELRGSIKWFSPHEGGTRVVIELPL